MNTGIIEEAEKILNSKKYRYMHPDTVADVLENEHNKNSNRKKALNNARVKLHQIWASYLGFPQIEKYKKELAAAFDSGGDDKIKSVCLEILNSHISTRERIPILEEFYSYIFDQCGGSVLIFDLASALNPFSIPWMRLKPDAGYVAFDINLQYTGFLEFFFKNSSMHYTAEFRDIYVKPPQLNCDVAFLFKMYHCLEKRKRGAGMSVLKNLGSKRIALTFPTRSLANRTADIASNYENEIYQFTESRRWKIKRKKFSTEDLFLIECSGF